MVMAAAFLLISESTFLCALSGLSLWGLMGDERCTSLIVCIEKETLN